MSTAHINTLLDVNQDINLISPVMRPEEIRNGDPISCVLYSVGETRKIKLWSYCPFGFEFIDAKENTHSIGQSNRFGLELGKTKIELSGSMVYIKSFSSTENIVGVRVNYNNVHSRTLDEERRLKLRWNCPEHLLPTGTAPNPTRYNDFIFFKVIDISANGVKLATSLRNKMLCIGQALECTISVPMIGTFCATIKINRVGTEEIQGKEHLILGVTFLKPDDVVSSTLSEYLLTFAENCSVKSLKEAGFKGALGTAKFDFSYSKSSTDYNDVLQLRFDAYKDSGKLLENVSLDFMRDEFDSRSRILTIKANGKLVGSARAMFHDNGDKTSHERYLDYPDGFPDVSDCLEVSRVCVKTDYQGAGLARELAKHLALLTIKAGRKYIYLSAAGDLVEFWLNLGFKDTGVTYVHKQLGNMEHKLLINDVEKSILGRDMNAKNWLDSYEHLYNYCIDYGLIEPSVLDQIRIQSFRTVRKFF